MRGFLATTGGILAIVFGLRMGGFAPPTVPDPETAPGAAVNLIATAAADLDLRPLWDNLPATWRADANALVDAFRASANPELWALSFAIITSTAELCAADEAAARGIDHSTRLAAYLGLEDSDDAPAQIRHLRLRLSATLNTISASGLDKPGNLAHLHLRPLTHGFLPAVEVELQKLDGQADATLMRPEFRQALVDLAAAGAAADPDQVLFPSTWQGLLFDEPRSEHLQLVQIEGCWVDERIAQSLPAWLADTMADIDDWTGAPDSPSAQHMGNLMRITQAGLDRIGAAAQDPAQVDTAIDQLASELIGEVMGYKLRSMF